MFHKALFKRLIVFTYLLSLLFCTLSFANVQNNNVWTRYDKELYGEAVYAMELNSGLVLFEKHPDKKMYPASLTKIMTAVVVLDNVSNLDEKL